MIETIEEITVEDLIEALGYPDFAQKLFDATEHRVEHHSNRVDTHKKFDRGEGASKEYKRTQAYINLKHSLLKLISAWAGKKK